MRTLFKSKIQELLDTVNKFSDKGIGLLLPDGYKLEPSFRGVDIWIRVRNWDILKRMVADPEMAFGEGYMWGDVEVDGDLEEVLVAGNRFVRHLEEKKSLLSSLKDLCLCFLGFFLKGVNVNKESRNVQYHYDLGNDFYSLWLDESLTYSCAFFENPELSIEEAQREKRKIIYEKLLLKEGDLLVDIGCGWGSIIIEAAKDIGVRTVGITVSKEQFEYVKKKIEEENLGNKVEVYLMHYVDLPKLGKKFDKVVSVGMFEHVGCENIRRFFEVVGSVIKDGGLFLLHTIGKEHKGKTSRWMTKYIFPGGYLPCIADIMSGIKGLGFSLIDIDDWRMHYYLTLKKWRERFVKNIEQIKRMYGDVFVRMWYFYLTTSMSAFRAGNVHVFQFLFSKGQLNNYPVIKRQFIPLNLPAQ